MATTTNMGRFTFSVQAQVDTASIKKAQQDLRSLMSLDASSVPNPLGKSMATVDKELKAAQQDAQRLLNIMSSAMNNDLGTFNIRKFNQELKKVDLTSIRKNLTNIGAVGVAAFDDIAVQALSLGQKVKTSTGLIDKMAKSLWTAARIGISTKIFQGFTSTITQSIRYVEQLDSSLNDIRIVTKKSAEEMAAFSKEANIAAQNLGVSTKEYVQGSLTFYQQGLGKEDATKRAEIAAKVANVTGQSSNAAADQVTSIANSFRLTTDEIEPAMDKLAKAAATSASSFSENSNAMQKVAASAATVGASIDNVTAQIATVVDVTRESPEVIGTAFKTIYARIDDLKSDGTDEFGVTLGDVSGKLAQVGVNILDTSGHLKDMDEIVNDLGSHWQNWSKEQQQAVAIAVAGKRQYIQLEALMNNWDKYQGILSEVGNSAGELSAQQDIFMERAEAHLKQMRTAWENVQGEIFDVDTIKIYADTMRDIANGLADIIKTLGGGKVIFPMIITILGQLMNKQLAKGIVGVASNIKTAFDVRANQSAQVAIANQLSNVVSAIGSGSTQDERKAQLYNFQGIVAKNNQLFTNEQIGEINKLSETAMKTINEIAIAEETRKQAVESYNAIVGEESKITYENISQLTMTQQNKIREVLNSTAEDLRLIQSGLDDSLRLLGDNTGKSLNELKQQIQKETAEYDIFLRNNVSKINPHGNKRMTYAQLSPFVNPMQFFGTRNKGTTHESIVKEIESSGNQKIIDEMNNRYNKLLEAAKAFQQMEKGTVRVTKDHVIQYKNLVRIVNSLSANKNLYGKENIEKLQAQMQRVRETAVIDGRQNPFVDKNLNDKMGKVRGGLVNVDVIPELEKIRQMIWEITGAADNLGVQANNVGEESQEKINKNEQELENVNNKLNQIGDSVRRIDITSTFVSGLSALGSYTMALTSLQSIVSDLSDDSLTAGERISKTLTGLLMMGPMLISSFISITKVGTDLNTAWKQATGGIDKNTISQQSNTIANQQNTASNIENAASESGSEAMSEVDTRAKEKEMLMTNGATGANEAFQASLGIIGLVLIGVTAAITAFTLVINANAEAERKRIETLDEANKKQHEVTEGTISSREQEIEQLKDIETRYEKTIEVINDLTASEDDILNAKKEQISLREEYHKLLGNEISDIDILTASNEDLAEAIKQVRIEKEKDKIKASKEDINSIARTSKEKNTNEDYIIADTKDAWFEEDAGTVGLNNKKYITQRMSNVAVLVPSLRTRDKLSEDGSTKYAEYYIPAFTEEQLSAENIEKTVKNRIEEISNLQTVINNWKDTGQDATMIKQYEGYLEQLKKSLEDVGLTEEEISKLEEDRSQVVSSQIAIFEAEHAERETAYQKYEDLLFESDTDWEEIQKAYKDFREKNTAAIEDLNNQHKEEKISDEVFNRLLKEYQDENTNFIDFYNSLQDEQVSTLKIISDGATFDLTGKILPLIRSSLKDKSPEEVKKWFDIFLNELKNKQQGPLIAYAKTITAFSERTREEARKKIKPVASIEYFGITDTDENPFEGWIRGAEDYFKVLKKVLSVSSDVSEKMADFYEKGYLSAEGLEAIVSQMDPSNINAIEQFLNNFTVNNKGQIVLREGINADTVFGSAISNVQGNLQTNINQVTKPTFGSYLNYMDSINKGYADDINNLVKTAGLLNKDINANITVEEIEALARQAEKNKDAALATALRESKKNLQMNQALGMVGNLVVGGMSLNTAKNIAAGRKEKASPKVISRINTEYTDPYKELFEKLEKDQEKAEERLKDLNEDFDKALENYDYQLADSITKSILEANKERTEQLQKDLEQYQKMREYYLQGLLKYGVNATDIENLGASTAAEKVKESIDKRIDQIEKNASLRENSSLTQAERDTIDSLTYTKNAVSQMASSYDKANESIKDIADTQRSLIDNVKQELELREKIRDTQKQQAEDLSKIAEANERITISFDVETGETKITNILDDDFETVEALRKSYDSIYASGYNIQDLLDGVIKPEDIGLASNFVDILREGEKIAEKMGVSVEDLAKPMAFTLAEIYKSLAKEENDDAYRYLEAGDKKNYLAGIQKRDEYRQLAEKQMIAGLTGDSTKVLEDNEKKLNKIQNERDLILETDYSSFKQSLAEEEKILKENREELLKSKAQMEKHLSTLKERTAEYKEAKAELNDLNGEIDANTKALFDNAKEGLEKDKEAYETRIEGWSAAKEVVDEYLDSMSKALEEEIDLQQRAIDAKQHDLDLMEFQISLQQKQIDKDKKEIEQKKKLLDARKEALQKLLEEYQKRWELEDKDKDRQEKRENRAEKVAERAKTMVAASQGDLEALSKVEDLDEEIDEIDKELLEDLIGDVRDAIENGINDAIKAIEDQETAWDEAIQKQQDSLDALSDKLDPLRNEIEIMSTQLKLGPQWELEQFELQRDDFKKSDTYYKTITELLEKGFTTIGGKTMTTEEMNEFSRIANHVLKDLSQDQTDNERLQSIAKGRNVDKETFTTGQFATNAHPEIDETGNIKTVPNEGYNPNTFDTNKYYDTTGAGINFTVPSSYGGYNIDDIKKLSISEIKELPEDVRRVFRPVIEGFTMSVSGATSAKKEEPKRTKHSFGKNHNKDKKTLYMTDEEYAAYQEETKPFRFKSAAGYVSGIPKEHMTDEYQTRLGTGAKQFAENSVKVAQKQAAENIEEKQSETQQEKENLSTISVETPDKEDTSQQLIESLQPEELYNNIKEGTTTLKSQLDTISLINNSLDTIKAITPTLEISIGNMLNVEGDLTKENINSAMSIAKTMTNPLTALGKLMSRQGVVM